MKNPLLFLIFFFIILVLLIILSCEYFTLLSQKEWAELSDQEDDVIIYIGGGYGATPCYWKIENHNIERFDLEDTTAASSAYSIYVTGNNVYCCGYYSPGNQNACYWIGQKQYHLEMKNPALGYYGYSIKVINGIIFTAGFNSISNSSFWVNNDENEININYANNIFIQQISSSKHITYIGGQNPITQACYWKDGELVDLPSNNLSRVNSIYVISNTVYSCGNDAGSSCYWINKKQYPLPGGTEANSIFVSNNNIYVAGISTSTSGCYWKNGKQIDLNGNNATSIYIYNDNAYIVCYDVGGTYLWKNNEQIYSESGSRMHSVFVVSNNEK